MAKKINLKSISDCTTLLRQCKFKDGETEHESTTYIAGKGFAKSRKELEMANIMIVQK